MSRRTTADGRVRVAFDLRWISRDPGGITTSSLNVLRALLACESEFEFLGITDRGQERLVASMVGEPFPQFNVIRVPYGLFSLANQVSLAGELQRHAIDVLHSPVYLGLVRHPKLHVVVTVHDLTIYLHPECLPRAKSVRFYPAFAAAFRLSLREASRIIVVSHTTLDQLASTFPNAATRAVVVHPVINPCFFDRVDEHLIRETRGRYGACRYLILYVGRREPYRRLSCLMLALAQVRRQGFDARLTVAGSDDGHYPEVVQMVRKLRLEPHVDFTGFVPLLALRALYRAADVMAFPSSYEGFGLPPIEAMASGTPVVCSDCSAVPEAVGDAAVLVDPSDPDSIADGLRQALADKSLRQELIRRGLMRAQQFRPEVRTEKLLTVYRELLAS